MNYKIGLSFLLPVCILLNSCSNQDEKDLPIPPGILTQKQFSAVLVDFSLAECAANMNILNTPVQKIDSVYAFDPLIENGVRATQYDSSIAFYSAHPVLYKQVYDSVLVILSEYKAARNRISSAGPSAK